MLRALLLRLGIPASQLIIGGGGPRIEEGCSGDIQAALSPGKALK
jgi:hypothetical protein